MTRSLCRWFGLLVAGGSIAVLAAYESHEAVLEQIHQRADAMPVATRFVRIPVREPSGVAYHPQRDSLFIVSDAGGIVEMDLEFRVLHRFPLRGDLEGVAVHPATGTLFIASEREGVILEYDPESRRVLRSLVIDFQSQADFAAGLSWNQGLEGVTVVTTSDRRYQLFAVVEAKPARLIALSADISPERTEPADSAAGSGTHETVRIEAAYDLGLTRMSDVMFDPGSGLFLITSAGTRVLSVWGSDGRMLRAIRLPGRKPEGFCFLPNGDAIVAQDTGGLWVCDRLRPALLPR